MQKYTIDDLYHKLDKALEEPHPGQVKFYRPPEDAHASISLGVMNESVAFTFTLADENAFVTAFGECVRWDDATEDDLSRSVEFALNWLNDKAGEL